MLIGVLLVLAGFFGNWFLGLFAKSFDYENIKPKDIGKSFDTDLYIYYVNLDLEDKPAQFVGDLNDDGVFILVDLSNLSEADKELYYSSFGRHVTINGTLKALNESEFKEVEESVYSFYGDVYDLMEEPPFTKEEYQQLMMDVYLPYFVCIRAGTRDMLCLQAQKENRAARCVWNPYPCSHNPVLQSHKDNAVGEEDCRRHLHNGEL